MENHWQKGNINPDNSYVCLSLNGIRVDDRSILPTFMQLYYIDLNFKANSLRLIIGFFLLFLFSQSRPLLPILLN
jgi:hypothetical protein